MHNIGGPIDQRSAEANRWTHTHRNDCDCENVFSVSFRPHIDHRFVHIILSLAVITNRGSVMRLSSDEIDFDRSVSCGRLSACVPWLSCARGCIAPSRCHKHHRLSVMRPPPLPQSISASTHKRVDQSSNAQSHFDTADMQFVCTADCSTIHIRIDDDDFRLCSAGPPANAQTRQNRHRDR